MKRDVKFRGQTESGIWEYGNYVKYIEDGELVHCIVPIDNSHTFGGVEFIPVIAETVGQFTGLTDKDGKEIYEGDIVKVVTFGFDQEVFVSEIIYEKCQFRFRKNRSLFYGGQTDYTKMDDAIIIGNIHNNPELLNK